MCSCKSFYSSPNFLQETKNPARGAGIFELGRRLRVLFGSVSPHEDLNDISDKEKQCRQEDAGPGELAICSLRRKKQNDESAREELEWDLHFLAKKCECPKEQKDDLFHDNGVFRILLIPKLSARNEKPGAEAPGIPLYKQSITSPYPYYVRPWGHLPAELAP
jgi:hypothetical protein